MGGRVDSHITESEQLIRRLYDITSNFEGGLQRQAKELIQLGLERFQMDIGILSRIEGEHYSVVYCVAPDDVPLSDDDAFGLRETYCDLTVSAQGPLVIEHMGESSHKSHPAYKGFGLEAYVGIPIRTQEQLYGTLNFSSTRPMERQFREIDLDALRLMAHWLEGELHRRALESDLTESVEALKLSNKELQQFAYIVSHDLQAPLRTLSSYAQLLLEEVGQDASAQAQQHGQFIKDGAARMRRLIQDLLSYSRVGANGCNRTQVQPSILLGEVLRDFDASINETQAQITWNGLQPLDADPVLLAQVFRNLIGNAIKFRGPEGCNVQIKMEELNECWKFTVEDNGIGFDPKYAERVFQVFGRLHTSAEYPGTGIGLAVCKKAVERHGGRIWVESTPGEGTVFHFTLEKPIRSREEKVIADVRSSWRPAAIAS